MTFAEHQQRQQEFREGLRERHQRADDKVGNAEVDAEDVMDLDDLYDSERIAISRVLAQLSQRTHTSMELSAFQREARDRFAEIGFVVRVDYKKDMLDGKAWEDKAQMPEISILGRTEKQGEFDHERMGHEVRSNILGKKGQENVQKTHVAPGFAGGSVTKSGLHLPG